MDFSKLDHTLRIVGCRHLKANDSNTTHEQEGERENRERENITT